MKRILCSDWLPDITNNLREPGLASTLAKNKCDQLVVSVSLSDKLQTNLLLR